MEKTIPVKVAVRCRPLVSNEVLEGCQVCTRTVPKEQTIVLRGEKTFKFDYVFGEESSQAEIYEACVPSLLPRIFEGYNATVLAYGQTGSGKTFTMGTRSSSNDTGCDDAGIIARIVEDIFKHITTSTDKIFLVRATFLEIYKENIFDLFSKTSFREPLTIREDHAGTIRVTNLTEVSVTTPEETIQLLENASASRSTASTNMNLRSSRSHAIFTMIVEQRDKGDGGSTRLAKLHIVDLAGSERAAKTKAVGERLKEGIKINRGLSSLGNVISALCDGDPHVPYRDSKLTRLLQDSLGGNSHTVMIACISPADSNLEETLSTLRYAGRARRIKNKPVVNFDPTQARIARLRQQLQEVNNELTRHKEVQQEGGAVSSLAADDRELAMVCSRNMELESENKRLAAELREARNKLSEQSQRLNLDELNKQDLKDRLVHLPEQTDNLADADVDQVTSLLKDVQATNLESVADTAGSANHKETTATKDEAASDVEVTSGEQLHHDPTTEQDALHNKLDDLDRKLQAKEDLASKMDMSNEHLEIMLGLYEATKSELEREISALKKERDELSALIESQKGSAKSNLASQALAEERRRKILDLEERVKQLRKQVNEQSRLIRIKQDAERKAKKLKDEILSLKQNRLQLISRLKEEASRNLWQQSQHVEEIRALRNREEQQDAHMARLEKQSAKRINALKKRTEAMVAAKRRLEFSSRRPLDKPGLEGFCIEKWLQDELIVASDRKELKHHVESLIDARKSIAIEIHSLGKLLKNPDKKEDRADLECRLQELRYAQQEHNDRIAELQQKILDFEPEKHVKTLVANVNDLTQCKKLTTQAFQMLVEDTATRQAHIEKHEAEVQQLKEDFELQRIKLRMEHEEEKLLLLKHMAQSVLKSLPDMDPSLVEIIQMQIQEICNRQSVHDELKKKTEEIEAVEMERTTGRKVFFQDLSAKKPKKPPRKKNKENVRVLTFEDLDTSTESELDDSKETDPEWLPSSEHSKVLGTKSQEGTTRKTMKRSTSSSACKCRVSCRSGRCGCSRKQNSCTSMCSCKGDCSVSQLSDTFPITEDRGLPESA